LKKEITDCVSTFHSHSLVEMIVRLFKKTPKLVSYIVILYYDMADITHM